MSDAETDGDGQGKPERLHGWVPKRVILDEAPSVLTGEMEPRQVWEWVVKRDTTTGRFGFWWPWR